ncbi:uncharacterized protein LOC123650683 [Lemur catta]|uniref:uncharacterized protein LOC123650683 n=1 Tax=Lemur catta TaxID=9447 RepID=UPI001E26D777|nr:uncharacterized protein LOC123650683 [Lemur catta]
MVRPGPVTRPRLSHSRPPWGPDTCSLPFLQMPWSPQPCFGTSVIRGQLSGSCEHWLLKPHLGDGAWAACAVGHVPNTYDSCTGRAVCVSLGSWWALAVGTAVTSMLFHVCPCGFWLDVVPLPLPLSPPPSPCSSGTPLWGTGPEQHVGPCPCATDRDVAETCRHPGESVAHGRGGWSVAQWGRWPELPCPEGGSQEPWSAWRGPSPVGRRLGLPPQGWSRCPPGLSTPLHVLAPAPWGLGKAQGCVPGRMLTWPPLGTRAQQVSLAGHVGPSRGYLPSLLAKRASCSGVNFYTCHLTHCLPKLPNLKTYV